VSVSAAPSMPRTVKTANAPPPSATSTARQAPHAPSAPRPTSTTPKPKSDRIID
jgi:hypothetical protein